MEPEIKFRFSVECLEIGTEEEYMRWCSQAEKVSLCSGLHHGEQCLIGFGNTLIKHVTV